MRSIRVTYRAIFEQPQGALNAMGLRIPGAHPVEIFGSGEKWKAREIATPRQATYERLTRFTSPDAGKQIVEASFARKIQDWQIWGTPPAAPGTFNSERQLIPGVDICDLGNNEWGLYSPQDRTHISRGGPPRGSQFTAACGAEVSHKMIISTRANKEPECAECAEIYRQEFATK